jgi:hypothetical protein
VKTAAITLALSLVLLHFQYSKSADNTVNWTPILRNTDVEEALPRWHCYIISA